MARESQTNNSISSRFQSAETKQDRDVIRSEAYFTDFVIEHSVPISVANLATELFPKMFTDLKLTPGYTSKRTKTTDVANTLGTFEKNDILKNLECLPLSLANRW